MMLIGKKIVLRPLKKKDWQNTIVWRNDQEITGLVMSHPFPITENMEIEWFEQILSNKSNKTIYFAIDEINSKQIIGITFLYNIDWISGVCHFGILIGESESRGKGFGKEILYLIINYAFNTLNLRKITLNVVADNKSAIKLYENKGFKLEGQLEKHFFKNNKYYDVLIMSKIR